MHLNSLIPSTLLVLSSLGLGACVLVEPADDVNDEETLRLACDADVSVQLQAEAELLVESFRTSLSEMIGCGRLTSDLAGGVQDGIITAIIENRGDATPAAWTYEGDGVFTTQGGQADMRTQFYLGADFEFGDEGDPVEHNVFRVDSYLVGARVAVPNPLSFEAELRYDELGPLAEMLGYGAEPPNPIIVDLNALSTIGNRLAALHFESDISVVEAAGDETIRYDLHTERMRSNALLSGAPLRYRLDSLVARTNDTEIEVTDWAAEFFSSGNVEGSTSFEVIVDVEWTCDGTIDFPDLPRPSGD